MATERHSSKPESVWTARLRSVTEAERREHSRWVMGPLDESRPEEDHVSALQIARTAVSNRTVNYVVILNVSRRHTPADGDVLVVHLSHATRMGTFETIRSGKCTSILVMWLVHVRAATHFSRRCRSSSTVHTSRARWITPLQAPAQTLYHMRRYTYLSTTVRIRKHIVRALQPDCPIHRNTLSSA